MRPLKFSLRDRRSLCSFSIVVIAICAVGCGGGNASKPADIKVVPAPAPAANANPAPANTVKSSPNTKPAKIAPGAAVQTWPPGTDPRSIFDVGSPNARTEVSAPTVSIDDQFTVESGQSEKDSTQLIVTVAPPVSRGTPRQGFNLPTGFTAIAAAGYSDDGLPLRIQCARTGSTLVLVPAGVATIGSNDGPEESRPELSIHLDTFYLEMFEVTVEQFENYRQDCKEKKKPMPTSLNPTAPPRTPVLGVTFAAAQQYARWAAMDLPTEAEFEKAARGPNRLRTPWGDSRAVWPTLRSPETVTVVGTFRSDMSPYGAYDLAGNAKEWCLDLYSEHAHRDAAGPNGQVPHNWPGPKKVSNGNLRVVKGNGPDWSAWQREGREVSKGQPDVGFRCVLRILTPQPATGT